MTRAPLLLVQNDGDTRCLGHVPVIRVARGLPMAGAFARWAPTDAQADAMAGADRWFYVYASRVDHARTLLAEYADTGCKELADFTEPRRVYAYIANIGGAGHP
jgi:hypothetical protein